MPEGGPSIDDVLLPACQPGSVTRVIHHLDADGKVIAIEWEPAGATEQRRKCVVQMHWLLNAASALVYGIDNRPADSTAAEIRTSAEATRLREAMTDLRPWLAVMSRATAGGLKFPRLEPGAEEFARSRTARRAG
jgi:hypothetical protein